MWIKNLNVFQADDKLRWTAAQLEQRLADALCPACGAQTLSTEGFAPPLKSHGAMTYNVAGVVLAMHQEVSRLLPGPVVAEAVDARVEAIAGEQGRKVGRKERGDIKDQVIFELLPRAFTRSRHTAVLIDLNASRVWVDCASDSRAEQVISALREALGTLPVAPVAPAVTPAAVLTQWLREPRSLPDKLTLGNRCELQGADDPQAVVRCTAVDLSTDEVLAHLEAGMQVTKLNLSWDDQLEFDLTSQLALKRMRPLDRINDSLEAMDAEDAVAELQARLALQGAAIAQLLHGLYDVFGAEPEPAAAVA